MGEFFELVLIPVLCALCILLGIEMGNYETEFNYRKQAVLNGCAYYNQSTADFEWIKREGR